MSPRSSTALSGGLLLTFASACFVPGIGGCGSGTASSPTTLADFSVAASPAVLTLTPGGAPGQISVTIRGANGFASPVAVTASSLSAGITVSPTQLSVSTEAAQLLNFTASPGAAAGSSTVTLAGTSGLLTHNATIAINVEAAPLPGFSIGLAPTAVTLTTGAVGQQISVSVNGSNSFAAPVTIALSALPAGVTANPSTLMVMPAPRKASSSAPGRALHRVRQASPSMAPPAPCSTQPHSLSTW